MDTLTGLDSRDAFDAYINTLGTAQDTSVALLVLDIDRFKSINDDYGHAQGDAVLREIGKILRSTCERYAEASAFRVGGEEFALIAAGLTLREAMALGESLRERIEAAKLGPRPEAVTVSVGITHSSLSSPQDLFNDADAAMLLAKRTGRNRLVAAHELAGTDDVRQRRLVLNPLLFETLGKTMRIAFLRTRVYLEAKKLVQEATRLPVNAVSVLGPNDLMVAHLGDTEQRFIADLAPLLTVAQESGRHEGKSYALRYFTVRTFLKYHGHRRFPQPDNPDRDMLEQIVAAAQTNVADDTTDAVLAQWKIAGLTLGTEALYGGREGFIDAYVVLNHLDPAGSTDPAFFERILEEFILPSPVVMTVFRGAGEIVPAQCIVRVTGYPLDLFRFLEELHSRCMSFFIPLFTTTYIVVARTANRAYRNLLIPMLATQQVRVREVDIVPLLGVEFADAFLYQAAETQVPVIETVRAITDGLRHLDLSEDMIASDELIEFRQQAIRGIVLGRVEKMKPLFLRLSSLVEQGLRRIVRLEIERRYKSAKDAESAGHLPRGASKKGWERMTIGEARDALLDLSTDGLGLVKGAPGVEELKWLQSVIDIRNHLAHGRDTEVVPARCAQTLNELLSFVRQNPLLVGVRADAPRTGPDNGD